MLLVIPGRLTGADEIIQHSDDILHKGRAISLSMLKRQQLENISESMTNLSVNLDGVKVMKTPTASCIENGVVQVIELKEDIDKSVAMLAVVGNEALQIISKLQDLRTETMLDFIKRHFVNISGKAEFLVSMFQLFGSVKKPVKCSEGFPAIFQCLDNSVTIKDKCF